MYLKKYIYFGIIFFIISSTLALTSDKEIRISIFDPPVVDFTFNNNVCSGETIDFTSNVSGDGPFEYTWNFDDGETSTLANPSHEFNAEGCGTTDFDVSLTVIDDNGESTTVVQTVTVLEQPDIAFIDTNPGVAGPFNNCGNTSTSAEFLVEVGNISSSIACITSYDIDWGDGNTETNVNFPISHNYVGFGTYNMDITAIGSNGCSTTETYIVRNATNPSGGISGPGNTQNLCAPSEPIQFEITNWGNNTSDTTYQVDFGDGTTEIYTQAELLAFDPDGILPFPMIPHAYEESSCPNEFVVRLWIRNACAPNPNPATLPNILIIISPQADFEAPLVDCVNTAVQFVNTSESGFGFNCAQDVQFTWDFGDGNTTITDDYDSVTHIFNAPGNYTVTLFGDNFSCDQSEYSQDICIEPPLNPSFTSNSVEGCSTLNIALNNTTDTTDQCGTPEYNWIINYTPDFCGTEGNFNFINGTNPSSVNPEIEFINPGIYELILEGTNSCGPIQSDPLEIIVKQPPAADINPIDDACGTASFNPVANAFTCAPDTDTITYSWTFPGGTPATSDQLDPGTITYNSVGDYTVTFTVTNSCGTATVTEDFSVNEIPNITNADFDQIICSGSDTDAINITSDNVNTTFVWTSNNPAGLIGFIPNGVGDTIPVQNLVNTTGAPVTLIYTVIPEINGCVGPSVNFNITVEPAPFIDNQPQPEDVCLDGIPNDLSVSFQGAGTPSYQWYVNTVDDTVSGTAIAGANGPTYTPPTDTLGTLYYYVIITFTTGDCNEIVSDTAEITVEELAQITTEPIATQSICVDGFSEELSVIVSGGAGNVSYQWFSNTMNNNTGGTIIPGATSASYTPPVFTNTGTFYYYVEVNFTASGCPGLVSEVAEIIVVDDPQIISPPFGSQSVCQNTAVDFLEVEISGGLGTASYQWYVNTVNDTTSGTAIAGATAAIFTPPSNTVGILYYYCIVTQDVSGCEVTSTVATIEVTAAAQFSTQPISDELCLGESTSALSISYTNGTGTPNYQWYENTVDDTTSGTPIAGATTNTYLPLVNTVGTTYYYVIITFNTGGCSEIISNTAEITVNETPSIADGSVLICSGNDFEFLPEGVAGNIVPAGTLYTWTAPVINPIGSITGASEQTTPSATISQLLTNTTTNPATVTYTVTPNANGCIGNDFEVVVTVNPSISVDSVVSNNSCFDSDDASIAITITGGVPFTTGAPYQINWVGPNGFTSSDVTISNLEAGTYTLDIIDDGGCPYSESFVITEPDELTFTGVVFDPETISCFGANDGTISIDVGGGTLPYTYNWTLNGAPFSSDEDLVDLGPGTYDITVTDANNCGPINLTFVIEEPPLLESTLQSQTNVICFGEATGSIVVDVSGGRPIYAFSWTGPNGFTSTDQNLNNLFAGTYDLTVTDSSNCTDTLSVVIIQNDQIDIDVTTTEIECYGDNDASITINSISGGVAPYDIAWSNFGTGMSQTNLSAGTYTITITDAEDCERAFPIIIEEAPIFLIDPVVTQMSCAGEDDASIVLNFQGGIDPVTVVWDDDASAGVERNNLAPGTYNVTITDGTPCVIQESFTIFDILPLQLSANVTDALDCDDPNSGAINLLIQGGTPPFTVSWSNGATTEDLTAVPPNTYVVTVTDANGCDIQGSWDVNRFEPLVLDVETQSDVDCETKTVNQTFVAMASGGVPPFTYNWSSGTVSGANNELMTTDEDGLVLLEVTDAQGCIANFSLNVDIPILGDPDFDASSFGLTNFGVYSIDDPITFTNLATGDYVSILWDFGDGNFSSEENPTHTYNSVGSYVVTQTVTYPFGCVYERVITLFVEKGYKLIMPDAFTPNEDGINDFFGPVHVGLQSLELNIYDTWGSLIYTEDDDNFTGWDGKINDEVAENGNYYYTFSAKTFYGKTITAQGAFVFIK